MRFPSGECFYVAGGRLSMINRKHFNGWHWATPDEVVKRWAVHWRSLPIFVAGGRNWWR